MDLILLRDYIGLLAPLILFILSLFFLRNKTKYLLFFIFGFVFNNIFNALLKLFIKEPRPTNDQKAIEIGITNGARISFDKYGMPSGHAQNAGFALAFITLTLNSPEITCLYAVLSVISLYQRYLYNNHTILQLIIGFLVGVLTGYGTYVLSKHYIMGNIKMKKDDYFMG
jgi:membrane-associated phospholipid phosphatase